MSGRAATQTKLPGRFALSLGRTEMPTPPGWAWAQLTDIAQLESGHTPSRKMPSYWDGVVPWIGIKDARKHHGQIIDQTLQTVTEEGLENSAARLLPARTVCLSRTASVGYSLIMGRAMATSQDFVNWICSEAIDPAFLMHLFVAEKESLLRFGKGTTHTTIYYPEVKALHVCVPPLPEQKRIVHKIQTLQANSQKARTALEAIPPLLGRFRQSVLAAAFRGDLTADWRAQNPDVEPASVLLDRIRVERRKRWEEAELAKMKAKGKEPKNDKWKSRYREPVTAAETSRSVSGWRWVSLDELLRTLRNGTSVRPSCDEAGLPILRISAVRALKVDPKDRRFLDPESGDFDSYLLQAEDLLFTRYSGNPDYVGVCGLVPPLSGALVYPDKLIRGEVVDQSLVHPPFLGTVLNTGRSRQYIVSKRKTSAGQVGVAGGALKGTPVPLPPFEEQKEIANRAGGLLARATSIEQSCTSLTMELNNLNQSILHQAFQGKLVPQDPNDEPASVLLERIRNSQPPTTNKKRRNRKQSSKPARTSNAG